MSEDEFAICVGSDIAKIMEYGTLRDSAKPYVRPAIETVKPRMPALYKQGGFRAIVEAIVVEMKINLAKYGQQKVGETIRIEKVE